MRVENEDLRRRLGELQSGSDDITERKRHELSRSFLAAVTEKLGGVNDAEGNSLNAHRGNPRDGLVAVIRDCQQLRGETRIIPNFSNP